MVSIDRLGWYARRLRGMSVSEVAWRAADEARRLELGRRRVGAGALPPVPAALPDRRFTTVLPAASRDAVPPEAAAALIATADRVLAGRWSVLGVDRADSADPDWFRDPVTGLRAPADGSAFRINHRDEAVTGNVKQVWEMSRHHHLTVLAAAWWLTGDERYADVCARQLSGWWRANPFLSGIHWTSGIEVGIRLLSWVWIRRLLDEWPKVGDLFENDDDALRQLAWHQEYLAAFRSRGSSANNHVIAELAGRLAAACAFPWFDRSAAWREQAAGLLEHEIAANTFGSGLNRELATDYHRFVLELSLLAATEATAAGSPLSEGTWTRVIRMLDAGAALLDVTGRAPRQGDGDEGRALVVDDPEDDPWAVVLGAASQVVGPPAWWSDPPVSVEGCLLAALARSGERPVPCGGGRPATAPRRFADAGCVILRSRAADGEQIWCRADVGPHGFLSIAAHAHADALSLEVRHEGIDILADPGTYCYHGEPQWRTYFRSTAAHNTLRLAGTDQAESGGPFLWTTKPRCDVLSCDVGDAPVQRLAAEHDGYRRSAARAVHRREVTLDSVGRTLRVTDTVLRDGPAVGDGTSACLTWQFGPAVAVELSGTVADLTWRGAQGDRHGRIELDPQLAWSVHRGEEHPPVGWYSPRFGAREPATCLLGRTTGTGPGTGTGVVRFDTRLILP